MNRWNIPAALEAEILARDTQCIYCSTDFSLSSTHRGARPSWEHIINDASIVSAKNVARCCNSCNASKGAKLLSQWLSSTYCLRKGISSSSMAAVVLEALQKEKEHLARLADAGALDTGPPHTERSFHHGASIPPAESEA